MVVAKDFQRTPFACKDKVGRAVVVEVSENGSGGQTDVRKRRASRFVGNERSIVLPQHERRRRLRVTHRNHASADKQIQGAVVVDVRKCEWADAGILRRQNSRELFVVGTQHRRAVS